MNLIIRKANIDDVFYISKLHAICWKQSYKDIVSEDFLKKIYLDDWCEEFSEGIKTKTREVHIALLDDNVIGAISCGNNRYNIENYGEIMSLYVHPVYQGSGIGTELLNHCISYMKDNGYKNLCLYVFDKNEEAKRFYIKNGFKDSGQKKILKIDDNNNIEEALYIYDNI